MLAGGRASGEKHSKTVLLCLGDVRDGRYPCGQRECQVFAERVAQERCLRVRLKWPGAYYHKIEHLSTANIGGFLF